MRSKTAKKTPKKTLELSDAERCGVSTLQCILRLTCETTLEAYWSILLSVAFCLIVALASCRDSLVPARVFSQ